ncbi:MULTISPECIES: thiamine diphosphokinase [Acetobacterium]|jgi:thiamine pyrophosphokinase|uniref:Thiamine diphosphokinase n=1 Tax=Acetobacterium wieringae TaxID=52694 RepID=A0A1F2PI22_9FIRM|nr:MULTISPECIES: thiamine diphosphokinase [Acetobacterium]OFV70705.1 thiamine pyrophosphokinase [Acetobacterium wieringae]TYC88364.1 thiamine diphosphokinase [Acetobacterium wieringae]URN83011.1 thiamine diphosphokinase [Acetobacterium wieringae]
MKVIIFTNGEYKSKDFYETYINKVKADYLICADGGANFARELKLKPNIIIGDMDSITAETSEYYKAVQLEMYPQKKDETDTELAIMHAIKRGADKVIVLGGLGSRMDHSIANIYLLKRFTDVNIEAEIVNENNQIRLLGKTTELSFPIGTIVSILPIGENVTGLTITGFEYPISAGEMSVDKPYGISNVVNKKTQRISFEKGLLMVIVAAD